MTSILKVSEIQDPTNSNSALSIDSSGRILTPARPAFRAYKSGAAAWQSFGSTSPTLVPFDATFLNVGNCYDTTNYKFVVPIDGIYTFYFHLYLNATTNDAYIRVDGASAAFSRMKTANATVATNYVAELNAGQEVQAFGAVNTTDSQDWYSSDIYSFFQGYLLG